MTLYSQVCSALLASVATATISDLKPRSDDSAGVHRPALIFWLHGPRVVDSVDATRPPASGHGLLSAQPSDPVRYVLL